MKALLVSIFASLFLFGCGHGHHHKHGHKHKHKHGKMGMHGKNTIKTHKDMGNLKEVYQFHHIYLAGQPNEAAIKAFKAKGGKMIINLRQPSEMKINEKALAKKHGLKYRHIPVSGRDALKLADMDKINAAVHENDHDALVMLHCASGNRAAAWLGTHLALKHKDTMEESLRVARSAGLTSKHLEKNLVKFVEKNK